MDSTITGVQYQGKVAVGSFENIMKELDRFQNYSIGTNKVKLYSGVDGTVSVNRFANEFTVKFNDINYEKTFKSKKEAMVFLKEGYESFTDLAAIAMDKSYRLDTSGRQFILYGESETLVFNSIDELKSGLAAVPTPPSFTPELSGIDGQLFDGVEKNTNHNFKPVEFGKVVDQAADAGGAWNVANIFIPPDRQILAAVKKGAAPEMLLTKFHNIRTADRLKTAMDYKQLGALDAIFTDPITHKAIRDVIPFGTKYKKIRDNIGIVMEHKKADWTFWADELGLDHKYLEVVQDARNYFNDLGKIHGIPPDKWIENYLPHLRKQFSAFDLTKYTDDMVPRLLDDAFDGHAPKELHSFFEFDRINDIARFVRERDPMALMSKYILSGNRKQFMGPVIADAISYLNTNSGDLLNGDVAARMAYFLDEVAGMPHNTYNMKNMQAAGEALLNKMKLGNKVVNKDVVSVIFSTSYLATMAWRPWLAIRNAHQIFTTLAPRIGFTYVDDAMLKMANDTDGSLYRRIKEAGAFQTELPIGGGHMMTSTGGVTEVATKGLKWYKNADEYTRAVAYLAAESRFDKAYSLLKTNVIDEVKFSKRSGMTLMDDNIQNQMKRLMNEGKVDGAKNLFASNMVDETMFVYKPGMGNTLSKGSLIGKTFGQFGQYAMWYRSNIMRGLTQGTTSQKIGFALRSLSGGAALATMYGAIGIGATNFLPWSPMIFTGGPFYDLMNTIIQAPKSPRAIQELLGYGLRDGKPYWDIKTILRSKIVSSILPTAYQMRALVRGIDWFNKGNIYKGFMAFTSAPIIEDDPWKYYADQDLLLGFVDSVINQ